MTVLAAKSEDYTTAPQHLQYVKFSVSGNYKYQKMSTVNSMKAVPECQRVTQCTLPACKKFRLLENQILPKWTTCIHSAIGEETESKKGDPRLRLG